MHLQEVLLQGSARRQGKRAEASIPSCVLLHGRLMRKDDTTDNDGFVERPMIPRQRRNHQQPRELTQPQHQHHDQQCPRTIEKNKTNGKNLDDNGDSTCATKTKWKNHLLSSVLLLIISLFVFMVGFHYAITTPTTSTPIPQPAPLWLLEVLDRVIKDYTMTTMRDKTNKHSSVSSSSLWLLEQPRPWHHPSPKATTTTTTTTTNDHHYSKTTRSAADQEKKYEEHNNTHHQNNSDNDNDGDCALLFFGLPRSFRTLVLPSIIRYILLPNARHNCDVYVHYYQVDQESPGGRYNEGGTIQSEDVYHIDYATQAVEEWYTNNNNHYHKHNNHNNRNDNNQQQQQQWQQQRRHHYQNQKKTAHLKEQDINPDSTPPGTTTFTSHLQYHRRHRPVVRFTHDTDQEFWNQRNDQIQRYLTATVPLYAEQEMAKKRKQQSQQQPPQQGLELKRRKSQRPPVYFPWREPTWTNVSLINVVKQWHSIDKVFTLMEDHYSSSFPVSSHSQYSRLGMFRLDCVYLTPIDIALMGHSSNHNENENDANNNDQDEEEQGEDTGEEEHEYNDIDIDDMTHMVDVHNQHAIVPAFALYPVNDRMIYGPYHAVRVWATQRFRLVEERAVSGIDRGFVMHSERFCRSTLFPAMEREAAEAAAAAAAAAATVRHPHRHHHHPTEESSSSSSSSSSLIRLNNDICFVRARADTYVVASDCSKNSWTLGETRDWTTGKGLEILEQVVVGRHCSYYMEVNGEAEAILAGCRLDHPEWYVAQNDSGTIVLLDKQDIL